MRNTIYRQMVFCIDTYRTWIEVVMTTSTKEHVISRNTRTDFLVTRTLVLRYHKPHGPYEKGMTWTIPEHDLDTALATYRKQNGTFKSRMKKGASSPTAEDTENIIRFTTHGIVRLELVVRVRSYTFKTLLPVMTWIILQFVFLAMPVVLPALLYRSRRCFMARFYDKMVWSERYRRLYAHVLLIVLLLFHYVYTSGHPASSVSCHLPSCIAAWYSFRAGGPMDARLARPVETFRLVLRSWHWSSASCRICTRW